MEPVEKAFPDGMEPIGEKEFSFRCHSNISCFNTCCSRVALALYPYDIIRLKNCLKIDSEEFVREYTFLLRRENPFFPTVMMKLTEEKCPFLSVSGCKVYQDRPFSCRMYPLERAVSRLVEQGPAEDFYFIKKHPYCKGHLDNKKSSVKEWVRSQGLIEYNVMNDLWVEMDSLFLKNPWKGEGYGGEKQQLAFMVCYNIDGFRRFISHHGLLNMFRLEKDLKNRIKRDDEALLRFGCEWLKFILGKSSTLRRK
jgi:Fe-S-cluster containining protein